MAQDIEIEIKLSLQNSTAVVSYLQKNGSSPKESMQHDVYYNAPHRDFLENPKNINEWFRMRITDQGAQINYKDFQPHEAKFKTHATEYETNVDSVDQLEKILNALNFKKIVEVKKHRRSWNFMDTEISVDSVTNIGEYIEVEYKGDLADIEKVRTHLFAVLDRIGAQTGELEHRGYPHLALAKQGLLQ